MDRDGEDQDDEGGLRNELEGIRRDVRLLAAQVGGVPVRRMLKPKSPKEQVQRSCPACGATVVYKQRAKMRSFKLIRCPQCAKELYSRFGEGGFALTENVEEQVETYCPECRGQLLARLGIVPGSRVEVLCKNCERNVQVRRLADSVGVVMVGEIGEPAPVVSEGLLEKVAATMPKQPWPDGTATAVAKEIGVSKRVMASAVNELIRRGTFRVQVDGKLYEPVDTTTKIR